MTLSRRDLLKRSALGAGVLAVGNVHSLFAGVPALAEGHGIGAGGAYGLLVPDPEGLLDLPAGFSYRTVSRAGRPLANGAPLPGRFDGMGAFSAAGGGVRLVRNHEQGGSATYGTVPAGLLGVAYDPGAQGGTSTVVLDPYGVTTDEYVSLSGTFNNCAGGVTPWGTWLTCEETETRANATTFLKDHGFVFEVDPVDAANNAKPFPLTALGRYAHEAASIDPSTGTVYLTEDASNPNGLVYRCVPADPTPGYGHLRAGGTLSAMRCRDGASFVPDLSTYTQPGAELAVEWVPVPDPLASTLSTRKQFRCAGNIGAAEITRSRKFEGAWWGDGRAYIVCSFARRSDGSLGEHDGQVWSYDPLTERLRLEVRFDVNRAPEGNGADRPDGPDNITVSPWGGLVLCEDGDGVQHLLAVAPDGSTSLFARNHFSDSEFAGATFSPDRHTLFANIQDPGITFAITGPFARVNRTR